MKSEKKIHTRITQKEIDLVKALLEAGIKKNKIKEISGRSGFSIKIIGQCDGTLKDYHRVYRENRSEWLERKALKDSGKSVSVDRETEKTQKKEIEFKAYVKLWGYLESIENEIRMLQGRIDNQVSGSQNFLAQNASNHNEALGVISKRLDHIEEMMNEHIENHQAELTLLKSKKIIW